MNTHEDIARHEIIDACRRLYQKNFLAAADGNVSYRLEDKRILITPSGKAKGFLNPSEIAIVTERGEIVQGQASSELLMHLTIYQHCPEARCVVHAHPPIAIAWSIAYPELTHLPAHCMSELILAVKEIPIVPYARPGTADMGQVLETYLPHQRVFILARHGALTWGESIQEALNGMERIEHSAQILWHAKQLHQLTELPATEIEHLYAIRKKLGDKIL